MCIPPPDIAHRRCGIKCRPGYEHACATPETWATPPESDVPVCLAAIDANGMLIACASGWVLRDVAVGGRGSFYVPVLAHAATYRPTVQRFAKVMLEAPAPQAP